MKRFLIVLTLLALIVTATPAFSFEGISSFSVGQLKQTDQKDMFGYVVGLDIPTLTKSEGFQAITELTYLYAEEGERELEVIRAMETFQRTIPKAPVGTLVGLGVGFWSFIDPNGENDKYIAYKAMVSYEFANMEFSLNYEIVKIGGKPDIHYPNFSFNLFKF